MLVNDNDDVNFILVVVNQIGIGTKEIKIRKNNKQYNMRAKSG